MPPTYCPLLAISNFITSAGNSSPVCESRAPDRAGIYNKSLSTLTLARLDQHNQWEATTSQNMSKFPPHWRLNSSKQIYSGQNRFGCLYELEVCSAGGYRHGLVVDRNFDFS